MRTLVTGALGFLGHAVTRQLASSGHDVVALTSRPGRLSGVDGVHTAYADIRDVSALRKVVDETPPAAIVHLAALTRVRDSFDAPVDYFDVNVGGTVALLDALRGHRVPVVFASTGAIYGPCEGRISETQPPAPTNPYAASKLAAEQLLTYQAETGAIGTAVLRCFNIAGAVDGIGDSDTTRIIPKALAVAAGRASHVGINGDGSARREFTHVADVATAIIDAINAATPGTAEIYNVGSGTDSTMLDVVQAVENVTGRQVPVEYLPPKPEPTILMADSSRLRHGLNWLPRHSFNDIIRDAWAALAPTP